MKTDYGWFQANNLKVNGSKTDSTTFTLNSSTILLNEKLLGVVLDN